jgi:hypothetical protein
VARGVRWDVRGVLDARAPYFVVSPDSRAACFNGAGLHGSSSFCGSEGSEALGLLFLSLLLALAADCYPSRDRLLWKLYYIHVLKRISGGERSVPRSKVYPQYDKTRNLQIVKKKLL